MTQLTSAAVVASAQFLGKMQQNASESTNLYNKLEQESIQNSRRFAMSVADAIVSSGEMDALISTQEATGSIVNAVTSFASAGAEVAGEAYNTKKFNTQDLDALTQMKQDKSSLLSDVGGSVQPQDMSDLTKALSKSKGVDADGNVLSSNKKYIVEDDKLKLDETKGVEMQKIFDKLSSRQKESFLKQTSDIISRKTNDRYEAQRKFSQFNTIARDISQNGANAAIKTQEASTKTRKAAYDKDNSLESTAQNMNDSLKQKQDASLQKVNDDASRAAESLLNAINQFGRG